MILSPRRVSDGQYDDPLDTLSECHRQIRYCLDILLRIAVSGSTLTPRLWDSVERAVSYCETAAPWHAADEEESLFPRLRASIGLRPSWSLDLLSDLHEDQTTLSDHHQMISVLCRRWLDHTRLSDSDMRDLIDRLEALQSIYRHHIAIEEQMLFPLAARTLSARQMREIGDEIAGRRAAAG